MDLTALATVFFLAMAALGLDAVWHPKGVILEAAVAGKPDKVTVDDKMVNAILQDEVDRISSTPSVITKPDISLHADGGIAVAVATATNLQALVYALQSQFGRQPDQIKIALFAENDIAKVLVTGVKRDQKGTFEQQVDQQKGETVVALLHRAALVGMARVDPYLTALNLMQRHASDRDFSDVESLVNFAKSQLPPTPVNLDRSLFENLQGVLALFRGNPTDARRWFELALDSSPNNMVAALNLGFAALQLGAFRETSDRMAWVVGQMETSDRILLSTAYVTWGAARLGLHDINGADQLLAKALEVDPTSSVAWDLWSDVKRVKGDTTAAERLHQKALATSGNFENYAEVAALYFQLAWRDNQPVTRSIFSNPGVVSFH